MAHKIDKRHRDHETSALVITKVTQFITKMQLPALPRNYELFYVALSGHQPSIGRDILSLGHLPSQQEIDMIGNKYQLPSFARVAAAQNMGEATALISQIDMRLTASLDRTRALMENAKETFTDKPKAEFLQDLMKELQFEQTSLQYFVEQTLAKLKQAEVNGGELADISTRDSLTTLPNRTAFAEKLNEIYTVDNGPALTSLMLVNIDKLRILNEKHGTTAGNKALRRFATLFKKSIKKHDFVARLSGNEFAFLFDDINQSVAFSIAERIRKQIEAFRFTDSAGNEEALTISVGVADSEATISSNELYARAEIALLAARAGARNCTIRYTPDLDKIGKQNYLQRLGD